jgi:Fe2+ or Zn2+ uptake regulation protein
MNTDIIYKHIHLKGKRITKIRKKIVQILSETNCLMTQTDILTALHKAQLHPNRSTIFRELQFLTENNIVMKSTISNTDYFEIPQDHHHHLICLKCHAITKIDIGNHLQSQEKKIAKQFKYTITNHSLEFYGYCRHCQA